MRQYIRHTAARAAHRGADSWRGHVAARAIDATAEFAARSTLVLAPHPDDETLGCGATVARARAAGTSVTIVIATDGRHSSESAILSPDQIAVLRSREAAAAAEKLGVVGDGLIELGFADGSLRSTDPQLLTALRDVLVERRPQHIFVPSRYDDHPDHQALHFAAMRTLAGYDRSVRVWAYPIWAWAHGPWFLDADWRERPSMAGWALRSAFGHRPVGVATKGWLPAKQSALAEHASQVGDVTGEGNWSRLNAQFCELFFGSTELFFPVDPRREVPDV